MSTRYNTGNPIESTDVRDMSDNAKNFDEFSNSSADTFTDRFGGARKTIHGMNSEFDGQILNMGYSRIGTFSSGATLVNARQTLLWDIADGGDGQEYGWSGSFLPSGKTVPPGSTPLTTGGIAVGAWMSRFDPELRIQVRESLRRSYAEAGYTLVAGSFESGGALVSTNDVLLHESSAKAYSGPVGPVSAGTNPTSAGFVDRSSELLRDELASDSGYLMIPSMQVQQWRNAGDIRGWGALCDGEADDTTAWEAVAIHSDNNGGPVRVPNGTTIITRKITFNKPPAIIGAMPSPVTIGYATDGQGEPRGSIILSRVPNDFTFDINPPNLNTYRRGGFIENIHILADRSVPLAVAGKGLRLSNLGWNGSFNNICVEAFHGGGVTLSQVQDSKFNQLEIVDCGEDGGAPALTIDRWTNLCEFDRIRLESCGRLLHIGGGASSLDFICPHIELGDYGTSGAFGLYDRINQNPAISMQECQDIRFQGGMIIGATLNSQKLKFALTPDTAPYFMYINSDVKDLHFSDMWMGFGWGHGKFIEHKGGGSIVNCVLKNISSDVYSLNFIGTGIVFTGNTVNYAHDTTAVSGKVLGAGFAHGTIDDNRFYSYYPGTPVATSIQPFLAGQGAANNKMGINDINATGVNFLYDGSFNITKQHIGASIAGLTPGTTTLDLWKFDHNSLIYLNDSGSTITISNPQAGREVRVQNVSAGVVTINNVAPAPVALSAGQVAHFVYAVAGSSFRKAW